MLIVSMLLLFCYEIVGMEIMRKGREQNIVKLHGLWRYKRCYFFPFWCLSIVCGTN
jgi:hypothetical protein